MLKAVTTGLDPALWEVKSLFFLILRINGCHFRLQFFNLLLRD